MSAAQVRVAACGRRWGKTESLAVDIATLALDEARAGRECRQLVVAPTDAQARLIGGEVLNLLRAAEDCPQWPDGYKADIRQRPSLQVTILPMGLDAKSVSNDKKAKAKGSTPSLSRVIFRTAGRDGRSMRGLWAHRIVVDEAGYVPDCVLEEVLMPMLADVGGELVLASSPAGRRSFFYRGFARGEAAPCAADAHGVTYQAFQCPSTDNSHIDQAWLQSLREDMGESRYAQEVLAEFVDDYGAVFRADDIEGCLADDPAVSLVNADLVSAPVPGHIYSVGIDWGRKLDFTVVAVLDATHAPARLVGLYRMQGTGWEAQAQRVADIIAAFHPFQTFADGNSIGDPMIEKLGIEVRKRISADAGLPPMERFLFTGDSKQRLVDHLTMGLSARALTYPNHRVLLKELRTFEYQTSRTSGRLRMAAAGSGHDDTVMALALAWLCAPDGVPAAPSSLILLGSQVSGVRRDVA